MTVTSALPKTKEQPSIAPWPVQIEQLPLMPDELVSLAERVRRLCADPRNFREFLLARLDDVVGVRAHGTGCPLARWLRSELELASEGAVTVAVMSVGLHDCDSALRYERYEHVQQHPFWMRAFIHYIDRGKKRSVLGREALAVLDSIICGSSQARRCARLP
jgi:hypothetical protein